MGKYFGWVGVDGGECKNILDRWRWVRVSGVVALFDNAH